MLAFEHGVSAGNSCGFGCLVVLARWLRGRGACAVRCLLSHAGLFERQRVRDDVWLQRYVCSGHGVLRWGLLRRCVLPSWLLPSECAVRVRASCAAAVWFSACVCSAGAASSGGACADGSSAASATGTGAVSASSVCSACGWDGCGVRSSCGGCSGCACRCATCWCAGTMKEVLSVTRSPSCARAGRMRTVPLRSREHLPSQERTVVRAVSRRSGSLFPP